MRSKIQKIFTKDWYYGKYIWAMSRFTTRYCQKYSTDYALKERYYYRTGKRIQYSNPRDINEKLHWLARYWQNPLIVECADKYLVREYVKECGCEEILLSLYGVYDRAEEIDFAILPQNFVLKCNHGCGYNILCNDKSQLDIKKTREQLNAWLEEKFGEKNNEPHYDKITPKIICEQYLDSSQAISLVDYKIHCINGKPQFFLICAERNNEKHSLVLTSYSLEWEKLSLLKEEGTEDIPKPKLLREMIEYARILSKPFPYVRVDFYYVDNKIYFGELTFTPAANVMYYYADSTLQMMGKKLMLPKKYNE